MHGPINLRFIRGLWVRRIDKQSTLVKKQCLSLHKDTTPFHPVLNVSGDEKVGTPCKSILSFQCFKEWFYFFCVFSSMLP